MDLFADDLVNPHFFPLGYSHHYEDSCMAEELLNALARDCDVTTLSEAERVLLRAIKRQRWSFEKGEVVFREGEPAGHFLLVKTGICFNHRYLEDGSRQIVDIYFPGEVVALAELARDCHVSGLTTFSAAVILAYDKTEIKDQFSQSPRLSRLFIELISHEQANLTDRLVGISRHTANQRVAYFLLEVQTRAARSLAFAAQPEIQPLPLPVCSLACSKSVVEIPQVLIADALGLSIVHVNRVLRRFREAGYIRTRSHGIELLDLEALAKIAGWEVEKPRVIAPAPATEIRR